MTTHIPSLSELIEPYQHYPKAIQKALLLVESHPSLTLILTRSYRRVLRVLVSRVPKANGCALIEKVAADWLATAAEVSTKTVERAIKALVKLGLLVVGERRDDTGLFVRPTYQFTPALAALLQLPVKSFSRHKTILSDDLIVELNFKKDHPEIHEKKPETRNPIELPADLASAGEELEISPKGMAALRGEAARAGYKLGHIIACAKQRMLALGAKNGRAYRYLQTMIAKPNVDYAGRAAQEGREAEQLQFEDRATKAAQRLAGKAYKGHDGLTYRFRADGRVEQLDGGLMLGFVPMDQIEQLVDRITMGLGIAPQQDAIPAPAPVVSDGEAKSTLAMLRGMLKRHTPIR